MIFVQKKVRLLDDESLICEPKIWYITMALFLVFIIFGLLGSTFIVFLLAGILCWRELKK